MAQYESTSNHYFRPQRETSSHGHSKFDPRYWSSHEPTTPHHSHLRDMLHLPKHHRRHPPPPSVEDEVTSLDREHLPQYEPESDVRSRGTVDQEPILIELENHDRRFVLLSDASAEPNQGDRRRQRRSRANTVDRKTSNPKLKLDTDQPSLLERRKPAPYSFSKSSSSRTPSGDYFLSPEGFTPQTASSVPRSVPAKEGSSPTGRTPRDRASVASSNSTASYQSESDDSDLDAGEVLKRRSKHESRSARESQPDNKAPENRNGSFGSYNTARPPSLRAELSRASIVASLAAQDEFASEYRSGSRTPRASSRGDGQGSRQDSIRRDVRSDPSWNSTPRMDTQTHISIPGSGTASPGSPNIGNTSLPSSPHGSFTFRQDSGPSSPQSPYDVFPFEAPRGRNDRSVSYGMPLQPNVSNIPSRLSASARHNSTNSLPMPPRIDIQSPSPARGSQTALPYPDDDAAILAMPSVTKYQTQPESVSSTLDPKIGYHRSASMSSSGSYSSTPKARPVMPNPPSRQSSGVGSAGSRTPSSTSEDESSLRKKEKSSTAPAIPSNLPPCPRMDFSKGNDDWHCLEGYEDFDLCPTCYYKIVRPTPFRKFFIQSPRRPSNVSTRCDFGKPWTRLAWLLTYKQQRQDVKLIYAIANVAALESDCPGDKEAVGNWYGLQDRTGEFVPGFTICPRDKRFIEALFPSLVGTFTRLGGSVTRTASFCSLRTQSRKFPIYLDMLDAMHDVATKASRSSASSSRPHSPNPATMSSTSGNADPRPLIDLAQSFSSNSTTTSTSSSNSQDSRQQSQVRECLRDRVQHDALWHFMPEFPGFTVCESCFNSVIWPAQKRGSAIADRFVRTPQPVSAPDKTSAGTLSKALGQTCQLYSSRMRRVWDRAVQGGDMQLLVRKALERKEAEVELRKQRMDLLRLLGSLSGTAGVASSAGAYTSGSGGIDRERLRREIERVDRQWEDWQ